MFRWYDQPSEEVVDVVENSKVSVTNGLGTLVGEAGRKSPSKKRSWEKLDPQSRIGGNRKHGRSPTRT